MIKNGGILAGQDRMLRKRRATFPWGPLSPGGGLYTRSLVLSRQAGAKLPIRKAYRRYRRRESETFASGGDRFGIRYRAG